MNYKRKDDVDVQSSNWSDSEGNDDFYRSSDRIYSDETAVSNKKTGPSKKKYSKKPPKKKNITWKKGIVILILAGLLIAVFFTPLYTDIQNLWGGPVYPEKASFSIHRTFDINTNKDIDYNISLIVPEDIASNDIQFINNVDWGGNPDTFEMYGRNWKTWDETLSGGSNLTIQIVYDVETRTLDWGYNSDNIGTIDDLPDEIKDQYNKNQWQLDEDRNDDGQNDWMIQPDHPEIQSLADSIVKDEDNIYTASRAIYDWINNNIEYEIGAPGLPKHTAWVLESQSGDCDEQSFLYASLARAVGIPAYMELGVLYDQMADQWGGHGWIRQMVINDEGTTGWINIDPVNNQFFARGATRITFWVDDGIEGHLSDYYYFLSYSPGIARVSVSENFENVGMETEGQVVLGGTDDIPGFTLILVAPALIISIFVHKIKKES
ncbi:MAG: transglutaminase-like domain-containing protein [Thermoplasmatota archaeon]